MTYKSLIDEAMELAKQKQGLVSVDNHFKTASAGVDSLIKEANSHANALEYMALDLANDGTPIGQYKQEMLEDFFKTASNSQTGERLRKLAYGDMAKKDSSKKMPKKKHDSPAQSTSAEGEQEQPNSGKLSLVTGSDGSRPAESSSMDSMGDTMRESYKQAMSYGSKPMHSDKKEKAKKEALKDKMEKEATTEQTLYDILMNNKEAQQHSGDPAMMDSEMAGSLRSNPNSVFSDNQSPVDATKAQVKSPVRARLREAFGHEPKGPAEFEGSSMPIKTAYSMPAGAEPGLMAGVSSIPGVVTGAMGGAMGGGPGSRIRGAVRGGLAGGLTSAAGGAGAELLAAHGHQNSGDAALLASQAASPLAGYMAGRTARRSPEQEQVKAASTISNRLRGTK